LLLLILVIKMFENMLWGKKMDRWINGLLEINEFLENKKETLISKDEKLTLWLNFKTIIDEFNSDFMNMWMDEEYEKMDLISNLINATFDKLMKYAKI